jgi:hypothetical protein
MSSYSSRTGTPAGKRGRPQKYFFDDIITANSKLGPGELLEMILSEKPDSKVTYGYLAVRKHQLKKNPDLYVQPPAEKTQPDGAEYRPRRGRPPSPKMIFIRDNLYIPVDELITRFKRRFPKTHVNYIYGTRMKLLKEKISSEANIKNPEQLLPEYKMVVWKTDVNFPPIDFQKEFNKMQRSMRTGHLDMSRDILALAIKNSIDREGLKDSDAQEMAMHVLNFFGYEDVMIDNILETDDRDAFYMLEDAGILSTKREETTLYDGREWRIHYWLLKRENIYRFALSQAEKQTNKNRMGQYDVYNDDVTEDEWSAHSMHGVELCDDKKSDNKRHLRRRVMSKYKML